MQQIKQLTSCNFPILPFLMVVDRTGMCTHCIFYTVSSRKSLSFHFRQVCTISRIPLFTHCGFRILLRGRLLRKGCGVHVACLAACLSVCPYTWRAFQIDIKPLTWTVFISASEVCFHASDWMWVLFIFFRVIGSLFLDTWFFFFLYVVIILL